ncbi:hypothetical protein OIU79_025986 [Salix purpurea]|uniref:Uncharacterized protein n=1 Tax=Salix purpurea TaxID=77065 RepID=A0A9Q1A7Y5_SALPP|nr:hypothetical protein OIU79_025986 [Salix purpurea]
MKPTNPISFDSSSYLFSQQAGYLMTMKLQSNHYLVSPSLSPFQSIPSHNPSLPCSPQWRHHFLASTTNPFETHSLSLSHSPSPH